MTALFVASMAVNLYLLARRYADHVRMKQALWVIKANIDRVGELDKELDELRRIVRPEGHEEEEARTGNPRGPTGDAK